MLSCVIFEDEHLLVVNKPAGMNTHAPSPYAGEGIYEWLKHREVRWSNLSILHRLDKETSGVMVFGKTREANRSLTQQFTDHLVRKQYQFLTDRSVMFERLTVVSSLVRTGEKYLSRDVSENGERAETHFSVISREQGYTRLLAQPVTGRTHQIRAQAAANGFPILGDSLYGGTAAKRVHLHAAELEFAHPITQQPLHFIAPVDFPADSRLRLRESIVDPDQTNAFRLIHGAADGWPEWFVEKLGDYLLSQSATALTADQTSELRRLAGHFSSRGVYHKLLNRQVRKTTAAESSPQLVFGEPAPVPFQIRENGLAYELSFAEGYSVGLFLDQRDNRRRLLTGLIGADFPLPPLAGKEVLNTFAYTCGFSVCAAKAGARVTSLDLSRKYLDWGKRNFTLNDLDASRHDFIFGDTFDWFKRFGKKSRRFHMILLDPPTFSQSRENGVFQAEKDYGRLVAAALPLLNDNGILLASTNAAKLEPEHFLEIIHAEFKKNGAELVREHYVPQPPDFPVHREQPAYLKTAWFQLKRTT